jgi:RND family efflux transporter MFP subunit
MNMEGKKKWWLRGGIAAAVLVGAVAYFLLGAARIPPGRTPPARAEAPPPPNTATVQRITVTEWYEAVGTVRPRIEARIEPQVSAQIRSVAVQPGESVRRGQVLVSLDDRQFRSRLDQVRQAAVAAGAAHTQARSEHERIRNYFEAEAATEQQLEKAREVLTRAAAEVRRTEEMVREAEIALGYTRIQAPEEGRVLKRLAEPGDLAAPGRPLLLLETSGSFRLEAFVREGLVKQVSAGSRLPVRIDALELETRATVEEIVPYADPQTRTFLVKAALPKKTGLYSGMYGKLRVPVKDLEVVVVPAAAVRSVGQLEMVSVREEKHWRSRFVKTGRNLDGQVEILSGLMGGETIGW